VPSNEESVATKLQRIAEKANSDSNCQFTSLFHLMNEELLLGCFEQLRTNAASGIDGVTKEQYAEQLPENLRQLVDRLHRMAYIPQPVMSKKGVRPFFIWAYLLINIENNKKESGSVIFVNHKPFGDA